MEKKAPALRIDIVTLFPKLLAVPLDESMARQAKKRGAVEIHIHNLRDYARDKRRSCDDKPFGGGAGMVMTVQPIRDCLASIPGRGWKVMVSPRGRVFNHAVAQELAAKRHLVFLCGHYEGIDERVHEHLTDEEISAGDYVTTGGEFPALCIVDAVMRLRPGVLGNQESLRHESFRENLLDYPQYTTPRDFHGWKAPAVLLSGNHKAIESWRQKARLCLTKQYRPDLIRKK